MVRRGMIEKLREREAKVVQPRPIQVAQNDESRVPQLMPAGNNDPVGLISEELIRGGPHSVYLNALNCVRDLL